MAAHASKPSQANGDINSLPSQPQSFHASRPSMGGFRDRQGPPIPSINTSRASAINPGEMQTPGTAYNMSYTPLLPHDLLMGSPFQPGSPSTFASPQFQSFPSFSPQAGPAHPVPGMSSLNGQLQQTQSIPGQMYPSMMHPASPVAYGGMPSYGNQMQMNPAMVAGTSRTVYLGNIPPETSAEEILNHVRSGQIESVRLLPDKNCAFISFLDGSSAVHFHSDAILKKLAIKGQDIKIGWGKPSQVPSSVALAVQQSGASRNVYLGNLPVEITDDEIREELGKFGPIDTVKLVREKNIGFVHFLSIANAIKAVTQLPQEAKWNPPRRIFYGKDRCAYVSKTQQQNAAQYLGIAPGYAHVLNSSDRTLISNALAEQSVQAAAVATAAGGVNNLGNRTVYLGNIHPETTTEEICNVVRGGLLHHIRYIPDKHICFVTFIDPTSAASFFALSNMQGLMIHNRRLKIGWGKHSGALPPAVALAVSGGASRNVYIGNIDESWSEDRLRQDFSEFGEIELVNALREKSCAFVNFTNIANAIKAIEAVKSKDEYKRFKINFGKDRCGNAPRQIHGNQQSGFGGQAQGGNSPDGIQSPVPGPNSSLQPNQHPGASVSPANSGMSSGHQSNGANSILTGSNNNPLTMYLNQLSHQQSQQHQQQQQQQQQHQVEYQQQQISPSAYMNNNAAHAANSSYFLQSNQSVNMPGQPSHSTSLEPPGQPRYQGHSASNSFSVNPSGRGHAAAPSVGGLLAPQAPSSKTAHNRTLSMPAFAFNSTQQPSQYSLGGLSSGIGSLGNGVNGYGLAISNEGGLSRWPEEEVST